MQVYYFTRTNRSKNIAQQIATAHNVSANAISDGKDWSGPVKFIHAGAAAAKNSSAPVEYEKIVKGEIAIVVFPIWAGGMPPAVRSFMDENKGEQIIAVSTSAVSSLKEADAKLFKKVYEVKGKDMTAPTISL